MKLNLFQDPSFQISGRGIFRELRGLFQKLDTTGSLFISASLRTAPSANETNTESIEQLCLNTKRLHKRDIHEESMRWIVRNERRQQPLEQPGKKVLVSTAPASTTGPVIDQNVIPMSSVLCRDTN